ncbi:flagellar biosynthetic protein FliO, partial [Cellulomonas citrea]|uniref:flagellar biosynthetic protein FliO n=1 Tax=Cellulomonas citrea TaxID=1909423 RepID=UPI00135B4208
MDTVWLLLRVTLSLAVVLGLVWIAGRRLSGSRASRRSDEPNVQVIDRSSLGRHAGVAVLAVGNRRILVGYGEQRVEMLTELTPVVAPLVAPQGSGAGVPRRHDLQPVRPVAGGRPGPRRPAARGGSAGDG